MPRELLGSVWFTRARSLSHRTEAPVLQWCDVAAIRVEHGHLAAKLTLQALRSLPKKSDFSSQQRKREYDNVDPYLNTRSPEILTHQNILIAGRFVDFILFDLVNLEDVGCKIEARQWLFHETKAVQSFGD